MSDMTSQAKGAANQAKGMADRAGNTDSATAEKAGEAIQQSRVYQVFVCVGLIAFGLVHLVIGFIAVQMAWGGGGGEEASNSGALEQIAEQPFGKVILIVCAVGLCSLILWQLIEAVVGHTQHDGAKRLIKRLSSVARAIVYGTLAFTAIKVIVGAGSGGEGQKQSMVSQVMDMPGGRILIAIVGLIILGVGVYHVYKGIKKKFEEDLDGHVGDIAIRLGQIGYSAKGVAIAIVGFLFVWAAIQHNAEAAGDTNSALQSILEQPFGPYLLTAMALGLAAFACYCFVWAFNARHEEADNTQ